MTKGQLVGWGIAIVVGTGAAIAGLIWAILRDGAKRAAAAAEIEKGQE